MVLTEEQREIVLRVADELNLRLDNACGCSSCRKRDEPKIVSFVEAVLAALPKPEPVAWRYELKAGEYTFASKRYLNEEYSPRITPLYTAPPIDQDLLTVHRILQCVADCPPVEPGDSATLKAFKALCIETNRIGEALRAKPASEQKPGWKHVSNEWADELCNALCWMRNVSDGVATLDEAIAATRIGIDRCRELASKQSAPPATPDKVAELDDQRIQHKITYDAYIKEQQKVAVLVEALEKAAKHVRPTCDELYYELMAALAAVKEQ